MLLKISGRQTTGAFTSELVAILIPTS